MKIITHWFVRYRGIAVGILLVGSSIGGAVFNQLAGVLIQSQGWRSGIFILGVVATMFILLPLLSAVRIHPSTMGLIPDGVKMSSGDMPLHQIEQAEITYSDLFSNRIFYLMVFVTGAMWFCIVGVIQHQALFFKDLNTAVASKDVLSVFFLCSMLGKVIFGKLSDNYSKRNIMLLAVINLALGSFVLSIVPSNPDRLLWVYAVVFGIGFSGTFTMIQLLIAEYYHGKTYGKVLGLFTMVDTLSAVLGIMMLGIIRTKMGSYQSGFWVLLAICITAAACVLFLPGKQKS
jgi:MFS family permease